jgi:hypothetical protein
MLRQILFKVMVLTALPAATVGTALAQSNIDPANKFAWGEEHRLDQLARRRRRRAGRERRADQGCLILRHGPRVPPARRGG